MILKRNIKVPIFNYTIQVIVFNDYNEARANKLLYSENSLAETQEYLHQGHCKVVIPYNDLSSIVHEICHIINCIWRQIDYEPPRDNDEISAYLMEWLLQKINAIIDTYKKDLA